MAKRVSVRFYDENGEGLLGLSPTITIRRQSDNVAVIEAEPTTEDADTTYFAGRYYFDFVDWDPSVDWKFEFDAGVDENIDQRFKGFTNPDHSLYEDLSAEIAKIKVNTSSSSGNIGGVSISKNIERAMTAAQADKIGEKVLENLSQKLAQKEISIDLGIDGIKPAVSELGQCIEQLTQIANLLGEIKNSPQEMQKLAEQMLEKTKPHPIDTAAIRSEVKAELNQASTQNAGRKPKNSQRRTPSPWTLYRQKT